MELDLYHRNSRVLLGGPPRLDAPLFTRCFWTTVASWKKHSLIMRMFIDSEEII